MSINLTDELLAKTKKGKIASAKQVFLEGDKENLQQIGDKTHQLEDAIKDITVTGGASTANAVSYNNETSGMTAVTSQGAIDELATKNKAQDAIIETKAEKAEVTAELEKKFDKESILQESGDAEDKVMSQKATTTAIADETTRAKAAEEAIIFDVSAHNDGATFESLSALLCDTNLSTLIPTSVRHGGMSIRFIRSSDNKYVQYRYMESDTTDATFTNVANWQGVDEEPTAGSDNLVKSGAVADKISKLEKKVSYDAEEKQEVEMTDRILNGYIGSDNGNIMSWTNSNYSIFAKKFEKDGIIELTRDVEGVPNANVVAIMNSIEDVVVGNNVMPYIVDNGRTTPLNKKLSIRAGQYLVVGYHTYNRTVISFTEVIYVKEKISELFGSLSDAFDGVSNKVNSIDDQISYGEYKPASITEHILNGYINANTGVVESWSSSNYSIYKLQFANKAKIKLQRDIASVVNANVIAIVDDPSTIIVGANILPYIVDNGTTTPLDKEVKISAGQYLIICYHVVESQRTRISYSVQTQIRDVISGIQQSVSDNTALIAENTTAIRNGLYFYKDGDKVKVTDVILSSAYVDEKGKVAAWSSTNYSIRALRFNKHTDVRIRKIGTVYSTNEILCKCHTLNGIEIGGQIDGDIICKGSDYPFDQVIHFEEGEYLIKSGAKEEYSVFTIIDKASLLPYSRSLQGIRVDFEGDSVMEANSSNGGWATLIQQMEGVIATNNGVSGTKIASILQSIKSRTPSDYDMIIVEGGFNDSSTPLGTFNRNDYRDEGAGDYDSTTFYGAMEILCRYCLKTFPKAGVIVGYNWGSDTWNTTLADAMVAVCEKWGMPYVDLRTKAGFNLHTETLRMKYGIYNGDVPVYNESKGYALDEKTKYEGRVYKANQVIESPAGTFNSSLWTYIGLEYDQCHCNLEGYKKSVGAIIQMMKAL